MLSGRAMAARIRICYSCVQLLLVVSKIRHGGGGDSPTLLVCQQTAVEQLEIRWNGKSPHDVVLCHLLQACMVGVECSLSVGVWRHNNQHST